MTIRNDDYYMDGVWDWGILRGCFGDTKIEPTDIDGCVERNGHKLFLETKRPGIELPRGQEITLDSLVADGHTVIVIWGERNKPQALRVMTPFRDTCCESANIETLRRVVSEWFTWANNPGLSSSPVRMAHVLRKMNGADWCDVVMAEWVKNSN